MYSRAQLTERTSATVLVGLKTVSQTRSVVSLGTKGDFMCHKELVKLNTNTRITKHVQKPSLVLSGSVFADS